MVSDLVFCSFTCQSCQDIQTTTRAGYSPPPPWPHKRLFIARKLSIQFSSVAQSCLILCDPMDCSTPGFPVLCSNSCPWSWWCHPTVSSSVVPFSSCLQSFPASGSFPMSQFFPSGGLSIVWANYWSLGALCWIKTGRPVRVHTVNIFSKMAFFFHSPIHPSSTHPPIFHPSTHAPTNNHRSFTNVWKHHPQQVY